MSTRQPVLVKRPVDTATPNGVTLPRSSDPERDFWMEMRRSLLNQLHAIERKLGIVHGRCIHCKNVSE